MTTAQLRDELVLFGLNVKDARRWYSIDERDWRAMSAFLRNSSRNAASSSSSVSPGNAPVNPSPRLIAPLISAPV